MEKACSTEDVLNGESVDKATIKGLEWSNKRVGPSQLVVEWVDRLNCRVRFNNTAFFIEKDVHSSRSIFFKNYDGIISNIICYYI